MVEPRVYLFLGSDELEKSKRLDSLQKKTFPPELKEFNYSLLYGDDKELTLRALQEELSLLPLGGAKKRLVVIRNAHKLSRAHQECLLKECCYPESRSIIVLEASEAKGTEGFAGALAGAGAQVIRFKSEASVNAFDLGRAIASCQAEQALKILSRLVGYKEKAEKILGAVFWQWERLYSDGRVSDDAHKKGLKLILDADKRLKSSSSSFAREILILEALVVKLSCLPR